MGANKKNIPGLHNFLAVTLVAGIAALLAFPPICAAAGFKMNWVESEVTLDRDGKARVSYSVRWTASGGPLHGFYFEGLQESPVFDRAGAYALDGAGNRYPLEINKLSDKKYDIVLADGRAFTDGKITYFFRYTADLERSGSLALTDFPPSSDPEAPAQVRRAGGGAGDKRLVVFNWAPVQWQDAMAHQAVTVRFPVSAESGKSWDAFPAQAGFRTDKFVNERYLVDYPEVKNAEGERVFSARFFRRGLESRYHFRIQVYLDARYFELKTGAPGALQEAAAQKENPQPAGEKHYLNRYFPGGMLAGLPLDRGGKVLLVSALAAVFCLLPFLIMTVKHRSMLTAQEGLSAVKWDGTEWTPPKLQMGTFRKPGKVSAKLTPIEAGMLLGMPVGELLSLSLANMERKGLLKIKAVEPLCVERKNYAGPGGDPYENVLLNSVKPDGTLDQGAVNETVKTIAAGLEQKLWDCDLAASRTYYKKQLDAYQPGKADTDKDYYWGGYRRRFNGYINPIYARVESVNKDLGAKVPELASSFENFRTTQACYEGAFNRNVCHDACHSACHSACVSAGH